MQITGKQGTYLKKEYSANEIVSKINEMKDNNYQVYLYLNCYEQPNTAFIGGYNKSIDFNRPSFYLKSFTSEDIGILAENVDSYSLFVRICEGETNSKQTIPIFNNI